MFVMRESTALYPSIYLSSASTGGVNFRYVQALLKESNRIAELFNPKKSIFVYTKYEYEPYTKPDSFYTQVGNWAKCPNTLFLMRNCFISSHCCV